MALLPAGLEPEFCTGREHRTYGQFSISASIGLKQSQYDTCQSLLSLLATLFFHHSRRLEYQL